MDGVIAVFEATKDTIETVAHILIPPPGGTVMVAVFELASFAIKAMKNSELCLALAKECAGLMRTVLIHNDNLRKNKDFQAVLDEFDSAVNDVAKVVKEHAGEWGDSMMMGVCLRVSGVGGRSEGICGRVYVWGRGGGEGVCRGRGRGRMWRWRGLMGWGVGRVRM